MCVDGGLERVDCVWVLSLVVNLVNVCFECEVRASLDLCVLF